MSDRVQDLENVIARVEDLHDRFLLAAESPHSGGSAGVARAFAAEIRAAIDGPEKDNT